jgi:ferric-dicitrate binding protein FerR (iron transport regulator)
MIRADMKRLLQTLLCTVLLLPLHAQEKKLIDYRFDAVRRTVTLKPAAGGEERQVARGEAALSGDRIETGWFSSALISADGYRSRFELSGSTTVTLADGTAGVILAVDRGRVRAAFDKLVGAEPRVVKTPGALLAVRGTEFDIIVTAGGDTTVDVFEGIVEVRSPLRPEPIFVRAGEESRFGRNRPPEVRPMPEHRRNRDGDGRPRDDGRMRPEEPRREPGMGDPRHGGGGGHGGHPAPPPSPPPTGDRPRS